MYRHTRARAQPKSGAVPLPVRRLPRPPLEGGSIPLVEVSGHGPPGQFRPGSTRPYLRPRARTHHSARPPLSNENPLPINQKGVVLIHHRNTPTLWLIDKGLHHHINQSLHVRAPRASSIGSGRPLSCPQEGEFDSHPGSHPRHHRHRCLPPSRRHHPLHAQDPKTKSQVPGCQVPLWRARAPGQRWRMVTSGVCQTGSLRSRPGPTTCTLLQGPRLKLGVVALSSIPSVTLIQPEESNAVTNRSGIRLRHPTNILTSRCHDKHTS